MKRIHVALLTIAILLVTSERLFSQSRPTYSYTIRTYTFQSETDSSFKERRLFALYDSADIKEVTVLNTDVLDDGWQWGVYFLEKLNQQKQQIKTIKHSWDMALEQWEENNMYQYFHDQWGNDTLYLSFQKNGTEEWRSAVGKRYINSYNDQDQLTQIVIHTGYPGQESPNAKHEFSYDTSGNRILFIRSVYDGGGHWKQDFRDEWKFDAEGREVEHLYSVSEGDVWIKNQWIKKEYNSIGNNTVYESNSWDRDQGLWFMRSRDDMTYDPAGRMLINVHQTCPAYGESIKTVRDEFFYNLSGKVDTKVISTLDEGSGLYVLTKKEFTSYGGEFVIVNDSICTGETYLWEGESIQLGGEYRKEYKSATGLDSIKLLYLYENPNPASFLLLGVTEVEVGQEELYIAPEDESLDYCWSVENGSIINESLNDTIKVRWESSGSGIVSSWANNVYGCNSDTTNLQVLINFATGVNESTTAGIKLYPVPIRDILYIQSGLGDLQIDVVELTGRKVAVANGASIDLTHLSAGPYVVRLTANDGTLVGTHKIIKE